MSISEINNRDDLKFLLKNLKIFHNLRKNLWKRSFSIFRNLINNTNSLIVEYYPMLNKDLALDNSLYIYSKIFKINPKREDIIFKENNDLQWWMRIIMNDKMIDLSYLRVENTIKSEFQY